MKMPKFFKKESFILLLGEDGAVLAHMIGSKVESRLFAASSSQADTRNFNNLVNSKPGIPLYLLLDTMDQSYTKQSLPAVSAFNVAKLAKKRLERDFADTEIKGYFPLGREKSGRRDWKYIFSAATMTDELKQWLDYILSLDIKFRGIYLLPIEMTDMCKKLGTALYSQNQEVNWQLMITHNKVGGFRQVVLQDGNMVFTRLIRPGRDTMPDIIAGNIEQETLNTIEYLRRLSFTEDQKIDINIIVSSELKKSLESNKINIANSQINISTPHEAAQKLNVIGATLPDDKFVDLLIASFFATSRKKLRLQTKESTKIYAINHIYDWSFYVIATFVPMFSIFFILLGINIINLNSQIKEANLEKTQIQERSKNAQSIGEYDISEANKISDFIGLYSKLQDIQASPFDIINGLQRAIKNEAIVTSINWNNERRPGAGGNKDKDTKNTIRLIANMDFYNTGNNVEELFRNFDNFSFKLKDEFKDYNVDHSKLPNQITFGERTKSITIQVSISGPK